MKSAIIRSILAFIAIAAFSGLNAQEIHQCIAATGGDILGASGSVSYSVGQIVYTTLSGENGSVNQGVEQIIEVVDLFENRKTDMTVSVSLFPNPVSEGLILKLESENYLPLQYHIYDLEGNLLLEDPVDGRETLIDLSDLIAAEYLLVLTNPEGKIKTCKILKK